MHALYCERVTYLVFRKRISKEKFTNLQCEMGWNVGEPENCMLLDRTFQIGPALGYLG